MTTRIEKERFIKQWAADLEALYKSYRKCVSIIHNLDEATIDTMYRTAIETDRLHNDIYFDNEAHKQ